MRFHVLAVPHTISLPEYSCCAFTTKVVKLCKMLHGLGHEVIHYGHTSSNVQCAESVSVTDDDVLEKAYPGHDWRKKGFPEYKQGDAAHAAFTGRAIVEIHKRKQPNDFLLVTFGGMHLPVAKAHNDMIVVESGIGYPNGHFAPFKVWESYAAKHAYFGLPAVERSRNDFWYDAVIPNAFDLDEFSYTNTPQEGLLFLGRVSPAKGIHIAVQLADRLGEKLTVAGVGEGPQSPNVTYLGAVGPEERSRLFCSHKATICASTFLEPFCGTQIESMISGTPVISTDWGAFAEYNIHGVTGFRCGTFGEFVEAARRVGEIPRHQVRAHGLRFGLTPIAQMYEEYFKKVLAIRTGKGWYEEAA